MQHIKCIVFDWDGTLMDSAPRIISAMQTAAENVGLAVPTEEDVRHIIGLSLPKVFDALFPARTQKQNADLMEEYRYQYVEGDSTPTPLFEGAKDTLELLRNKGFKLSVATGKARPGLSRVLNEVALHSYFDFTIAADEAESKPHPDMLHKTASHFNVSLNELLMVGDTSFDMEMAKNARTDSVAATYGAHTLEKLQSYEPNYYINSITELSELFK